MGTNAWHNWLAFREGASEIENADDELYSDRHFVGEPADLGPFSLAPIYGHFPVNDVAPVRPAVRLRVGLHTNLAPDVVIDGELAPSDSSAYHGGTVSDEIAALTSLTLGVRLRFAGTSRLSGIHAHMDGLPPMHFEVPPLAHPGRIGREHIPAALSRSASLSDLERLPSFPTLDETSQVALVRAARAYATGLWWSNEDQNQAWLHLITAVEIAANHRQQVHEAAENLIAELWPELWNDLQPADPSVQHAVCKRLANQVRATRKFTDFLTVLVPAPPEPRPRFGDLDWTLIGSHARVIYDHRSKALHAGKPFPLPMLGVPQIDEDGAMQEVPWGLNSSGHGAVWDAKEYPMLLATFEHTARGALINWWDELAGARAPV